MLNNRILADRDAGILPGDPVPDERVFRARRRDRAAPCQRRSDSDRGNLWNSAKIAEAEHHSHLSSFVHRNILRMPRTATVAERPEIDRPVSQVIVNAGT